MARKPNYRFERQERDRKKAAKKEAKAKAKAEKTETGEDVTPDNQEQADPPAA